MILNDHRKNLIGFTYLALVICIAIGFLQRAAEGAINGTLFFQRIAGGFRFNDYLAFYSAGKIVLSDLRSHIYEPSVQANFYNATISQFYPDAVTQQIPLGQSVPWFFTWMAPFALVPILPSFVLWNLFGAGLSVCGLLALLKLKGRDKRFITIFLIGMFGCFPTQWLIRDGQNTWLLLAPLCLYLWGWFARKDIASGIGLAFLIIKPQYAIFMGMPALACKRWKLIAAAVVVSLMQVGSAIAIFGWQTIMNYPAMLKMTERTNPAVFPTWQISMRGPLSIVLGTDSALSITSIAYGAALLVLLIFWIKSASKASDERMGIAFAITFLGCFLTSPHTHVYDFVLFAAIAAITIQSVEWFKTTDLIAPSRAWCRLIITLPFSTFLLYILTAKIPIGEIVGVFMFILDLWLFAISCKWYISSAAAKSPGPE